MQEEVRGDRVHGNIFESCGEKVTVREPAVIERSKPWLLSYGTLGPLIYGLLTLGVFDAGSAQRFDLRTEEP
ncbi:hypothetical protein NQZ68_007653, partial [Dissostichus eleginoides]